MDSSYSISIKSTKEKKDIQVNPKETIKQLKELCSKEFLLLPDQICLIFAGCILKDEDSISIISSGSVVHLIVKSAAKTFDDVNDLVSQNSKKHSQADIEATPFNLSRIGGIAGLTNIGFGSANFMDLQQKMQKEMFANPELLKMLVENPIVNDVISKPSLMMQLITCNPQMLEIMQENPEIVHMINNPTLLKQMIELAKVPTVLQEMVAPKYRQFSEGSQIEVQEASSEKTDENPKKKFKENPLETEWLDKSTESVMRQYMENSQSVSNMMHSPYVQATLTKLSNNPQMLQQLFPFVPVVQDNPELLRQMQQAAPYFAKQLGSVEMQSLYSNGKAMQALLDIQQGMQCLYEEVPGMVTSQTGCSSNSDLLMKMLQMVNSDGLPGEDAEKSYALQLHQLKLMGFVDKEKNIQALSNHTGDVNAAIGELSRS